MSSGGRGGKRRGAPPPAPSAKRADPMPGTPQPPPPAAAAAADCSTATRPSPPASPGGSAPPTSPPAAPAPSMVFTDDENDLLDQWWEEEESDDDDLVAAMLIIADAEERNHKKLRRGSVLGRQVVPRDRHAGNLRIVADYFADPPIYNDKFFRRRFRMSKPLFLRIVQGVEAHDDYFRQRPNAVGLLGATALQKVVGAFRMLAYDVPADSMDKVVRIAESTMIEAFKHFVRAVVEVFGEQYLRPPTVEDTARLLEINNNRGWPGMLGCIDCMHWRWKNCPTAWKCMYSGHVDGPTMILEAVASEDLWIWHSFFGLPGSLNDINVLRRSPLFQRLTSGTSPPIEYTVNGNKYTMGYYLADEIYPSWATFVKSYRNPQGNKKSHFTQAQEAARKDVERAFGVLQSRFAMIRGPARFWGKDMLWYILTSCVIIHNMIIENERDDDDVGGYDYDQDGGEELRQEEYQRRNPNVLSEFLRIHNEIEDKEGHDKLRNDLVEHLWARHGAPFQQLEIDYVIGESHKELLPNSSGPAAILRIFGVTREGHSVCCQVHGFEPYFYISCPSGMDPDDISRFQQTLEGRMKDSNRNSNVPRFVKRVERVQKQTIMHYQPHQSQPFLKIVVALPTMVASCRGILERGITIEGLGSKSFLTYESNILFALRVMIDCNIVGGNWIEVPAGKYRKAARIMSYCQLELDCLYSDLLSHAAEGEYSRMAPFRILSFDIECAGRKGHFPEPTHDPVIQIANLVTLQGEGQPFVRNVMTLKSCSPIVGVDVMSFEAERDILLAWRDFIREVDPDIIIGYNICKFDLPYLIERAEVLKIVGFPILGRIRNSRVRVRDTTFSSRQYGVRESKDVTVEGRVQFDLLQAMQRDYKLSSYSLNSVSAHFLGEQKKDVHHSIISDLQNGNSEARRRLAVYCLKDAYLPQRLLDKLMYIYNYVEMARVTGVPISFLLSRGQSIKVLSQLLRKAKQKNLVIPNIKGQGSGQDTFEGATVLEARAGFYEKPIATLDFASLYPSIMMAYNFARHRKQKIFIPKLVDGEQVLTSHVEKERAVFDFYNGLLGLSLDREHTINLEELNIVSHDLAALEVPFSEDEVWKTICQLPMDKAPGPDGFTGRFYKACWPIMKSDIMAAFAAVWSRKFGNFGVLNSAYITLIPKKAEALHVKDFRPISLVHSFAKLVTKILANRLAVRLHQMISPNQSAFIKGRFIQDNFMLVQQLARFLHQQRQPHILLKLDITKAFDSVS